MSESRGGTVYPPAEAARLLSVSVSGLRRYGLIYEGIFDQLPRDSQGRRLWTPEAVTRLRRAKALMAEGRAVSIEAALGADETSVQELQETEPHDPSTEAFTRLTDALNVIVRLEQTNQQLVKEMAALREKLEEGDPNADELRRMNAYLMEELKRYQTAPAQPERSLELLQAGTPVSPAEPKRSTGGALVRVAARLERLLGRLRGR